MKKEIQFVKSILPKHYTIKESNRKGSIHCKSKIGIRDKMDADDNEHWEYIVKAIRKEFGDRFLEIDHQTNFCHVDFTIHLKTSDETKRTTPFCQCLHEIENKLPRHKFCFIPCREQREILKERERALNR